MGMSGWIGTFMLWDWGSPWIISTATF